MKSPAGGGIRLGVTLLCGATLLFAIVLTRAILGAPETETATPVPGTVEDVAIELPRPSPPASGWDDVELAAEMAPFEPDRRRSEMRYILPGERVMLSDEEPEEEPQEVPRFSVLGVADGGGDGVAIIRLEDGPPQLLALGQSIAGYRVTAVAGTAVQLSNGEQSLWMSVEPPPPTPVVADQRGRRGRDRDDDDDDDRNGRQNAREMAQQRLREAEIRLQQQLQQLQQLRQGSQGSFQGAASRYSVSPDGSVRAIEVPVGAAPPRVIRVLPRVTE